VITFASGTGTFSSVTGLAIGNGKRFQINYGTTKVTLVVVPE